MCSSLPAPVISIFVALQAIYLLQSIASSLWGWPSNEANEVGFFLFCFVLRAATEQRGSWLGTARRTPAYSPAPQQGEQKWEHALLHNPPFYLVPFTWATASQKDSREEWNKFNMERKTGNCLVRVRGALVFFSHNENNWTVKAGRGGTEVQSQYSRSGDQRIGSHHQLHTKFKTSTGNVRPWLKPKPQTAILIIAKMQLCNLSIFI